jgi:hypothetical protein
MDTSNGKEEPNNQEYVVRRKEVKEEEAGSGKSSTDSVNSVYEPNYQIYLPLGWSPGCG